MALLTSDEIAKNLLELKSKHKKVYTLTVPIGDDGEDGEATIFLRKPDRATYSLVSNLVSKDKIKAIEGALKNLYIGGDKLELVLEDTDALVSCESAVVKMMATKEAVLKKN